MAWEADAIAFQRTTRTLLNAAPGFFTQALLDEHQLEDRLCY